jgi:hypothetical protein
VCKQSHGGASVRPLTPRTNLVENSDLEEGRREGGESASRPPSGFWMSDDK